MEQLMSSQIPKLHWLGLSRSSAGRSITSLERQRLRAHKPLRRPRKSIYKHNLFILHNSFTNTFQFIKNDCITNNHSGQSLSYSPPANIVSWHLLSKYPPLLSSSDFFASERCIYSILEEISISTPPKTISRLRPFPNPPGFRRFHRTWWTARNSVTTS